MAHKVSLKDGSRASVTFNTNISETSWPIAIKYLNHHWVGGKAAIGLGPAWIRTLVSMATNSFHRVIMAKTVLPLFSTVFIRSFKYTQVTRTCIKARRSSKVGHIQPPTAELVALDRQEKST